MVSLSFPAAHPIDPQVSHKARPGSPIVAIVHFSNNSVEYIVYQELEIQYNYTLRRLHQKYIPGNSFAACTSHKTSTWHRPCRH